MPLPLGDAAVLRVYRWNNHQEVEGSTPTRALLRNNPRQVVTPLCLCHQAV